MKRLFATLLALSLMLGALGALAQTSQTQTTKEMIDFALKDELNVGAFYQAVLAAYPGARPFINLTRAEQQHYALLLPLAETYAVTPPERAEPAAAPASLEEAVRLAILSERENIAAYQRFLDQGDLPEDVQAVFERLLRASGNHLAALERQAQRPGGGPRVMPGRGGPRR